MLAKRFGITLIVISIGVSLFLLLKAPPTSRFYIPGIAPDHVDCIADEDDQCLRIPAVTGVNLDNQPVTFPQAFQTPYILVVMPFDREQQVLAETWLPFFRELADDTVDVSYYSIAALPKLNPAVRALVIGGMSVGVRDPLIRGQMSVLFLEDQDVFLDALQIESIDLIRVFVFNRDGTIFWRGEGVYDQATAQNLSDVLTELIE